MHSVLFIASNLVLRTFVTDTEDMDEGQIIAKANVYLKDHYGWDVAAISHDIEVEKV